MARLVSGEKFSPSERASWVSRYCVDMTSREIYEPQDYYRVALWNRIFIWSADVMDAVSKMNLLPGGR